MAERFNCRLLLSCFVFILPGAECKVCPSECKDGLCQPNGLCDECRDGFYGIRCNKKCPPTCTDSLCYRFNVSCKKECSEGLYGKKCDKQCSRCPGSCHWRTGDCAGNSSARMHLSSIDHQSPVESEASEHSVPVCPSECKDGLCQPSGLCDDCRDGFYGIRCNKKCPPTCTDSLCYRFNVSCKKECSEGLYGKKCDKQCSRCPGSCHWRTGECAGNSSARMHLSSIDHQSPVESEASEHSVPDPMLLPVVEIGIPVAGILVIALTIVIVCVVRRKRRLTTQSRVPEVKDTSKQSDNASAEPLVET